ncbi:MAG TPA: UDP-N-acetylmuramate--L-alanine ligase [Prolixibacteraceae bacterium]|nr:UDP-N-acetylmuramate--L-alanine ligase [Prolixibacteraceae bacterium]
MIDFNNIENLYFLGIGGIGMSALARFAKAQGKHVCGYDLTATPLTRQIETEGIAVHYTDNINQLPNTFLPANTLVVRTPAVPENLNELQVLQSRQYNIVKRSQLLGFLTNSRFSIAVAGTHGKTSVTTMIAHLLHQTGNNAGAFLGGISRNFNSNLVLPAPENNTVVIEADEYDRSFLQLKPSIAVITSVDPDHLDIYGTYEKVREAFGAFLNNVDDDGIALINQRVNLLQFLPNYLKVYTYSIENDADFHIQNLRVENQKYIFDFHTPYMIIPAVKMGYPGKVNVENMVAAAAAAILAGSDPMAVCAAVESFKGVIRRFDVLFANNEVTYIDDYAHHPRELEATINSIKELYADKKVLGIFQPHLYSRTNDFADGFAQSLDLLDEAILLDIYPAREHPIPGVTSKTILDKMKIEQKTMCSLAEVVDVLKDRKFDVLLTMGAGSIDQLSVLLVQMLNNKYKSK